MSAPNRESLEAKLIRCALPGFSKAEDLPGGFVAYIGKPDDRPTRVAYVKGNSHSEIHRLTHNRIRDYVRGL